MKTRILSGLLMLPLLVFVYLGGYFLIVLCLAATIFAVREFYKAFENASDAEELSQPIKPSFAISIVSTVLLYGVVLVLYKTNIDTMLIILWLFVTTALSFLMLFPHGKHSLVDVMVTIIGNVYIVFFFFHVVMISMFFSFGDSFLSGFNSPIWFVFLAAFGSDIFAYFVGVTLGKHKLCPNLSPKKTVEGLIGGILGSTLLCGLFASFAMPEYFIHGIIIGAVGAGMATLGDLTASAIKHRLNIKDYGTLIPGHGGILDRFDSVLFTGPFVFYYFQLLSIIN